MEDVTAGHSIEPLGGQVALSWPADMPVFSLETADSLLPVPGWVPVFQTPISDRDRRRVVLPVTGKDAYHRLR